MQLQFFTTVSAILSHSVIQHRLTFSYPQTLGNLVLGVDLDPYTLINSIRLINSHERAKVRNKRAVALMKRDSWLAPSALGPDRSMGRHETLRNSSRDALSFPSPRRQDGCEMPGWSDDQLLFPLKILVYHWYDERKRKLKIPIRKI
ncbi:unnamed protein product [Nezara viridula]|uniref:Uncharacterized protein n=1 Tax=Nezara viridula TaxID=85310 RepID=A0A9P0MTA2_NEZVI|nr:unnamed protein product [Nezara viridula]